MAATWLYVMLAILLDGAAGLTGGLLPEAWLTRYRATLVGFAAGVLLGAALLDILPDAIRAGGVSVLDFTLGTFVVMALFEWAIARHHHRRGEEPTPALPVALLGSDALHNIGDGAAIAAAFLLSPRLGVTTALAVIVHEVPEEIGDYALLRAAGLSRRSALLALAGVQLSAGLGAAATLLAWTTLHQISGHVLAIAGGTFLYISGADLLPDVLRVHSGPGPRHGAMLGFLLGLLILVAEHAL
jgi:zinc and cadmium transporter